MATIEVTELVQPKLTAGKGTKASVGMMLFVLGILSMVSIIGFLPGIGLFYVGFLMMRSGLPTQEIACQSCELPVTARVGEKTAECAACGTKNPIVWVKPAKGKAAA